jgi:hypothetical protein
MKDWIRKAPNRLVFEETKNTFPLKWEEYTNVLHCIYPPYKPFWCFKWEAEMVTNGMKEEDRYKVFNAKINEMIREGKAEVYEA